MATLLMILLATAAGVLFYLYFRDSYKRYNEITKFCEKFCYIITMKNKEQVREKIKLYPFQKDILREMDGSDDIEIIRQRQEYGLTTLLTCKLFYDICANKGDAVFAVMSYKFDAALEVMNKLRIMLDKFKSVIKIKKNNKDMIVLKVGKNEIKILCASTYYKLRGANVKNVYFDNHIYNENYKEIRDTLLPIVKSNNGSFYAMSTIDR